MPPTSHFTCLFLRDNTILEVLKKIYSKKYSILKKNLEVYLFQNRHQQIENRTGKTSRRIVNISKFLLKNQMKNVNDLNNT